MIKYMFRHKALNIGYIFSCLLANGAKIINTLAFAFVIDSLIALDWKKAILFFVLGQFGGGVIYGIGYKLQVYFQEAAIQAQITTIREEILTHLAKQNYAQFHQKSAADYVSWLTNDMSKLDSNGYTPLYAMISGIVMMVCSIGTLLSLNPFLMIVALALSIALLFVSKPFKKPLEKRTVALSSAYEEMTETSTDYLTGFDVLFHLNQNHLIPQRIMKAADSLRNKSVQYAKTFSWLGFAGAQASNLGLVIVVAINMFLIYLVKVSIGTLTISYNMAGNLFDYTNRIVGSYGQYSSTKVLLKKYFTTQLAQASPESFTFHDSIQLSNLNYQFKDHLIKFPEMRFERGGKYAIVGNSGSGKSTLLNILIGYLQDYDGEIVIDGHNLRALSPDAWRKNVAYVGQQPYVFRTTICDNVQLDRSCSETQMNEVIHKARASVFVDELPQGINTEISSKTTNLSGGQLQRITIARELLDSRPILLMDEGTSGLDHHLAVDIERELFLDTELTIIYVTHILHEETKQYFNSIYTI